MHRSNLTAYSITSSARTSSATAKNRGNQFEVGQRQLLPGRLGSNLRRAALDPNFSRQPIAQLFEH
jgi:hypothetical protein